MRKIRSHTFTFLLRCAGSGIQQQGEEVGVTQAGVLRHQLPNRVWVETSSRRVSGAEVTGVARQEAHFHPIPRLQYVPRVEDPVIGIITDMDRAADGQYRLSINGTAQANLPKLAFDGASKKNKPDLQVGTAVYARVASAARAMEPELSCQVLSGPKKDWVTGESLFGELKGGLVTRCSTGLAHRYVTCSVSMYPSALMIYPDGRTDWLRP